MYLDLLKIYWWTGMKRDIAEIVANYMNYQQDKVDHQRSSVTLQEFNVYTWKWEMMIWIFIGLLLYLILVMIC